MSDRRAIDRLTEELEKFSKLPEADAAGESPAPTEQPKPIQVQPATLSEAWELVDAARDDETPAGEIIIDHQEAPAVDNLELLTEIPGLSDAARRALLNVPLDMQNIQPAVDALFAAELNVQDVRDAMEQVLGVLNLRAAQATPVAEASAVTAPKPGVAPETVEAEAPAESAAVPEEDELSRFAEELGLSEQAQQALTGVNLDDLSSVQGALSLYSIGKGEKHRILSTVERRVRSAAEAPAPSSVIQPEQRWRMPKLTLLPQVAKALEGVDLTNAVAVKAALAKFATETRTQATAQLTRFKRAVDAAVAKLPKKPAAEGAAQPAQEQPAVAVSVALEGMEAETTGFAARFPAAVAAAEQFADPVRLQRAQEAAIQEWRQASSREYPRFQGRVGRFVRRDGKNVHVGSDEVLEVPDGTLQRMKKAIAPAIESRAREGVSEAVIAEEAGDRARAIARQEQFRAGRTRAKPADARVIDDTFRAVREFSMESGTPTKAQKKVGERIAFLTELGDYAAQKRRVGSNVQAVLKDLQLSENDLRGDAKKRLREMVRTSQNLAAMESVDGLLAHPDLPPELKRAIEMRLRGEVISHGTDQASQYRSSVDSAIVDELGIEPRPQELKPAAVAPAEIPAPEPQAEAGSARAAETPDASEGDVETIEVNAYVDALRGERAAIAEIPGYLATMSETDRNREVRTLAAAVGRLTQELQASNADPATAARTKENLKKLGLALAGTAASPHSQGSS